MNQYELMSLAEVAERYNKMTGERITLHDAHRSLTRAFQKIRVQLVRIYTDKAW